MTVSVMTVVLTASSECVEMTVSVMTVSVVTVELTTSSECVAVMCKIL